MEWSGVEVVYVYIRSSLRWPPSVNMGPFESEFSEFGVSVSLKIPNYFIL